MRSRPDALGAGRQRRLELARQLDIGMERDLGAVAGHRRQAAQPREHALLARQIARCRRWYSASVSADGLMTTRPVVAVDDHRVAGLDARADQAGDAEHRRQAERAGHDGGMALRRRPARWRSRRSGAGSISAVSAGRQFLGDDDRCLRGSCEKAANGVLVRLRISRSPTSRTSSTRAAI